MKSSQVLRCRQLGINAILVLEQAQELPILLEVSRRTGVRPVLGIRARLATRHQGHWGPTSGDNAKFGLRAREIVSVADVLASAGMLDCLQLLHFHMGSQVSF
jgi:arginine decarboxylase-like protein